MFGRRKKTQGQDVISQSSSSSRSSEDTVAPSEFVEEPSDLASVLSAGSDQTLVNNVKIFGSPVGSYRVIREFPIVSPLLQLDVLVFPSNKSLEVYARKDMSDEERNALNEEGLGVPLLETSTSVLSIFKKHAPYMEIYKYKTLHQKEVFCKVYFKLLDNNLTCFFLIFKLSDDSCETVILMNNGLKPSVDAIYHNSKVRVLGVTGTASTFASSNTRLFVMERSSPSLADDVDIENLPNDIAAPFKNVKVKIRETNKLYVSLKKSDRSVCNSLELVARHLVNIPFASFTDNGDHKLKGVYLKRNGTIRTFEALDKELNDTTLITVCILLVLREQEFRKNKGNKKPTFVNFAI